ncbi:MAG: fused MFS/spermidine synthase [Candidatus Brocadiia bacterium]
MNRTTKATVLVVLLGAAALAAGAYTARYGDVVYEHNSLYHRIFVHRRGSITTLRFATGDPGVVQSQVDLNRPRRHMLEYTGMAFCGLLYQPEPKRFLMLGLGGGVIAREMHHYFPDLQLDVAEIDPAIPGVAERFFGFRTTERLEVHVRDGRVFIRRRLREDPVPKYDYIVLDAFQGDSIPFHLMTREFFEQVKGVLADDGVVVANVIFTNQLCHSELKTIVEVFGRCQVYEARSSTNAMLVATGPDAPVLSAEEALRRARKLQREHGFPFDLRTVARRLVPGAKPNEEARVLTDDQAPVNWLRHQPADPPEASDEQTGG